MKKILNLFIMCLSITGCSQYGGNERTELKAQKQQKESVQKIENSIKRTSSQKSQLPAAPPPNTGQENAGISSPKKSSAMLDVVLIKQNPELKYGCEVTSLAMVLNYAGVQTNKMELYTAIQKDTDPVVKSSGGDILKWGNPDDGFVGDMTGNAPGYAVFERPMVQLINKYLPGRAVDLSNQPFENVLKHVSDGFPVVVWTTGDYRQPERWESWYHGAQLIRTTLDLHAVVLVGYDQNNVYINDPLSGGKQVKVGKEQFLVSWKALNCRAVSYK